MAKIVAKKKAAPKRRVVPKAGSARRKVKPTAKAKVLAPSPKAARGLNTETMLALLRRSSGATVAEIVAATGWQPHTTRAAISVTGRKLGLDVAKAVEEGRGLVYRAA